MKKFRIQLMKNVYTTEEIKAPDQETALRVVEDMIENGIDEFSIEEEDWQIDSIEEINDD
ncbi:MAG TPA: hypothetical protein VKZ44_05375 [Taishania sp.]|nr:hypothetical protein [Taishania sp.]